MEEPARSDGWIVQLPWSNTSNHDFSLGTSFSKLADRLSTLYERINSGNSRFDVVDRIET
jgi:hypothetical protein